MQKGKKEKKVEKDAAAEREDALTRHWDTWIVPGKFNLRDWYYLDQEDSEDLFLSSGSDKLTSELLDKCLESYIQRNVISYTLYKFEEDILKYLLLVKQYPDTLRNTPEIESERNQFDDIEPLPSKIDAFACGWPQAVYDPCFSEARAILCKCPGDEQIFPPDTSAYDDVISSNTTKSENICDKKAKKDMSRNSLEGKRRKISLIRTPRKSALSLFKLTEKLEKVAETIQQTPSDKIRKKTAGSTSSSPKSKERKAQLTPRFDLLKEESTVNTVETIERNKSVFVQKVQRQTKVRPTGRDAKMSVLPTVTFDHLEPSNFPQSRTKTGYVIKDLEVPKELMKTPLVKRAPALPKRGSELTGSAKSTIVADLASGNIIAMPSVVDKMSNLGAGVIARKDPKPKAETTAKECEDHRPALKPISRARVEPKLLISQLIDRGLPISSWPSKN